MQSIEHRQECQQEQTSGLDRAYALRMTNCLKEILEQHLSRHAAKCRAYAKRNGDMHAQMVIIG